MIDVGHTDTVSAVKERMHELRPEFPTQCMTIVCNGRALLDTDKVSTCGVPPGGAIRLLLKPITCPRDRHAIDPQLMHWYTNDSPQ